MWINGIIAQLQSAGYCLRLLLRLQCSGDVFSSEGWLGLVGEVLHSCQGANHIFMPKNTDPSAPGLVRRGVHDTFKLIP